MFFFFFCFAIFSILESLASCNERFPRRLCEFERSQLFLQRSYFGFAAFRFRSVDLPAMVLALSTHEYQSHLISKVSLKNQEVFKFWETR